MLRFSFLICAGVFLPGCVTTSPEQMLATQTPPPRALRAKIVEAARNIVYDPYSIRDAEISHQMIVNPETGLSAVCVKANAKNQLGAYVGRRAVSVMVMNGQLVNTFDGDPICRSPLLKYQAFPELEALRNL